METQLIRILPACLTTPLPQGWMDLGPEYTVELMPEVEHPEAVPISIQTTEPDILLVDADHPNSDPFALAQSAIAVREGLAVVFISEDSSPERLRRAMLAGAEEYLLKPLDVAAIKESIEAIASHRTLRMVDAHVEEVKDDTKRAGIVVGVVSGKGGLGKTTIAANLAAIVAKTPGKIAALVGLESGDGAIVLNLNPKLGLLDMASAASDDETSYNADVIKQFGTSHRSGLSYYTWSGSNTQAGGMPEDFFERLFTLLRSMSDVTLVDFPLLTADEAAPVLPLMDIIIVVSSSSDLLALRSTRTFLDLAPPEVAQRVRIVINRADPSDMISREDFEQTLEHKVAAVLPNEPNTTAQAINMGTPFVLTQPQSEVAINLRSLAQTLFKLPTTESDAPRKRRFMLFG